MIYELYGYIIAQQELVVIQQYSSMEELREGMGERNDLLGYDKMVVMVKCADGEEKRVFEEYYLFRGTPVEDIYIEIKTQKDYIINIEEKVCIYLKSLNFMGTFKGFRYRVRDMT